MTIPSQQLLTGQGSSYPIYPIKNSLRFRRSATAYLSRTFGTPTTQNVFTFSCWTKRSLLSTIQIFFAYSNLNSLYFNATDNIALTNGATILTSTAVFRDPSAWYHIFYTQSGTTVNIYVNNVLVVTGTNTVSINSAAAHGIGSYNPPSASYDGYNAEIYFVDGQALTPSSFGFYDASGVWTPLKYTGTYGNNGFYLPFSDTSALTTSSNVGLGKDFSGNGNYWTTNNISITSGATYDAMLDSPTNYPDNTAYGNGNYATLSPIWFSGSVSFLSAANLNVSAQNTNRYTGTIGLTSGKWYFEVTRTDALGGGNYIAVGAVTANTTFSANTYGGNPTSSGGNATEWVFTDRGSAVNNATYTNLSGTVGAVVQNDIVQVCIDMGTSSIWFGRNNTFSGSPSAGTGAAFTNLSSIMLPLLYTSSGASVASLVANFGQRPFTYTPPTGFMAISTDNLPTPPISEGANYMAAVTYTGNGSGSRQIVATSANSGNNALAATFQPDLVWIKSRSATTNHNVFDSVRGATNYIITNTSAADASNINSLTAFNTNGFTLGSDASSIGVNVNAATYVAWEWLAGAGSSSIPTGGTITPTGASINRTAGFSVITYTGTGANATIPHGLGATPEFILIKDRTSGSNGGAAYHTSIGATKYLKLFQTTTGSDAATTDNTVWNGGSPTFNSTVFSVGTNVRTNTTDNYVAYCWTSIPGYSAFGSYTGNGLADGPFVYLGFRPRWIVVKDTSAVHIWVIIDTSRDTINVASKRLFADLSDAENTTDTTVLDVLSNGFKLRSGNVHQNNGTNVYVYAAFAENPFKIARAR